MFKTKTTKKSRIVSKILPVHMPREIIILIFLL